MKKTMCNCEYCTGDLATKTITVNSGKGKTSVTLQGPKALVKSISTLVKAENDKAAITTRKIVSIEIDAATWPDVFEVFDLIKSKTGVCVNGLRNIPADKNGEHSNELTIEDKKKDIEITVSVCTYNYEV